MLTTGSRQSLKLLGIGDWTIIISWFATYGAMLLVTLACIIILMVAAQLIVYTHWSVALALYVANTIPAISFALLCSSLFSNSKVAAAVGMLLYFFSYGPYLLLIKSTAAQSTGVMLASCLLSTTALAFGTRTIAQFENAQKPLRWGEITDTIDSTSLPVGLIIPMMLLDAAIYLLLAWYISNVFPGKFGVPKPFFFFLSRKYWGLGGSQLQQSSDDIEGLLDKTEDEGSSTMPDQEHVVGLAVGVEIKGMRKVFDDVVAVDSLDLDFYQGQVTALLGHNGAGKTTLMSLLSGMIPPTSGNAYVHGSSIRDDIQSVRRRLGFCPQEDVLWPELSVYEHLRLYSTLRQAPGHEIQELLEHVDLAAKRDAHSKTLSGGQKRKLCIALAFVGNSKCVIMDEPSSGLDPSARREVWDLIVRHKQGRTVVLSTHSMEEADVLGDRIVIMSHGGLVAAGTPMALKERYGEGHHLTLSKGPKYNPIAVDNLIGSHVSTATPTSDIGAEVSYLLPSNMKGHFADLLEELEGRQGEMGVEGYGISVTTMEEVFLRATESAAPTNASGGTQGRHSTMGTYGSGNNSTSSSLEEEDTMPLRRMEGGAPTTSTNRNAEAMEVLFRPYRPMGGLGRFLVQIRAMMAKRFAIWRRDKKAWYYQIGVPLLFTLISVASNQSSLSSQAEPMPSLPLAACGVIPPATTILWQDDVMTNVTTHMMDVLQSKCTHVTWRKVPAQPQGNMTSELLTSFQGSTVSNVAAAIRFLTPYPSTSGTVVRVIHNPTMPHVLPALLSCLGNIQLTSGSVTVTSHPMPPNTSDTFSTLASTITIVTDGVLMMLMVAFLGLSFVMHPVTERTTSAKLLQLANGATPLVYWAGSLLWDMINYTLAAGLILLLISFFKPHHLDTEENLTLILLLESYGLSTLGLVYTVSFFFDKPTTAFNILISINDTLVVILLITTYVASLLPNITPWWEVYSYAIPGYCLGKAYMVIATHALLRKHKGEPETFLITWLRQMIGGDVDQSVLSWPVAGRFVGYLLIQASAMFTLLTLFEFYNTYLKFLPAFQCLGRQRGDDSDENEDVRIERTRVESGYAANDVCVLTSLAKTYFGSCRTGRVYAVQNTSIGIPRGECFGLLGVNGAGKSTTFKMLSGEEAPTCGDAVLSGQSIQTGLSAVRKNCGYCPQNNAFLPLMTGREMLTLYARLRGLREKDVTDLVKGLLCMLDLEVAADRQCGSYSGGMKRRLATGMAVMANPTILLLDEPTTGLDPHARRFIWDMIDHIADSGRAVILTSHSMEECEALCSRLAIMISGRITCLGSPQHLKNVYGASYTLKIRVAAGGVQSDENLQRVKDFVREKFPSSELTEVSLNTCTWELPRAGMVLSHVFRLLEASKDHLHIDDYSVSQTTLDQVFLMQVAREKKTV